MQYLQMEQKISVASLLFRNETIYQINVLL